MYWMKLRDLLQLPPERQTKDLRATSPSQAASLPALKESILKNGWVEQSAFTITDGKLTSGFIRLEALRELLAEGNIDSNFMVGVDIYRTMWVQQLVKVG